METLEERESHPLQPPAENVLIASLLANFTPKGRGYFVLLHRGDRVTSLPCRPDKPHPSPATELLE